MTKSPPDRTNSGLFSERVTGFAAHLDDGRGQSLSEHLLSVSELTRIRADKIGIGAAGALVGLLHDLGKYSGDFQRYIRQSGSSADTEPPEFRRGSLDHSTAGAQKLWHTLKPQGVHARIVGEILAICIASHHSGLIDCIAPDGSDIFSRRLGKEDAKTHLDEAWSNAEPSVIHAFDRHLRSSDVVSCLCEVINRIYLMDSTESLRRFNVGLLVRYLFSCLIDSDRTDTADFSKPHAASFRRHPEPVKWDVLVDRLERQLKEFSGDSPVTGLRHQISGDCLHASARPKGILTLTVPTGGGKTLASLRFGLNHAAKWNMDRIIYVSPYTSIIDQNAAVVRSILEPPGIEFSTVLLEHHSNLTPSRETPRSKILSENWDAPVVFTTAVQVLEALFGSGTRAARRLHQMANAVLIFDEIQTLPIRCVHLFNNAINFLVEQCGSSAVLCTATQPSLHLVDKEKGAIHLTPGAEIVPDVMALFENLRRCETRDRRKPGAWAHSDVARLAVEETHFTGSCLVVVNTKREALSIFRECGRIDHGLNVFHLSTSMCPAHRTKILAEVKSHIASGKPVICVSTQLIEAGADISFGSAIRALAGLDSIAQTAGRCNRHGEFAVGRVHVVNLVGDLPKALVDIRMAQQAAQRVLDENRGPGSDPVIDLWNPSLTSQYFRYYFFDRRNEMDYPVGPEKAGRDDTLLRMLAENQLAVGLTPPPPPGYLRQAFMTASNAFEAIDSLTQGVIVPYGNEGKAVIGDLCRAFEVEKRFGLLRRAQRFAVNVFPRVMRELQKDQAVHEAQPGTGILYLDQKYYSDQFGLNVEGTEEMEFQGA